MIIFVIILILLLLLFIYNIKKNLDKICNSLKYFVYDGPKTGKTVIILGGIHGNEPAGSVAIEQLMSKIKIKSGRLILVPYVNYCALQLNKRYVDYFGDMNRQFPVDLYSQAKANTPLPKADLPQPKADMPLPKADLPQPKADMPINKIIELVNTADFVIDFHEGVDFHRLNNQSIGSTITPANTQLSQTIASMLCDTINENIIIDYKKYKIITLDKYLVNKYPNKYSFKNNLIKGSLLYYANLIKKNYILIETTGQNDIQPLNIRVAQDTQFINLVLKYFNII